MSISIDLDLDVDPATGLRANASRIGQIVTPSSWLAAFDFNNGDTSTTVKNGTFFQSTQALGTPVGQTEQGLDFTYPATTPDVDPGNSEIRFTHTQAPETWNFMRVWIPENFFHRGCVALNVTGDISAWQVGDIITGVDTVSQGELWSIGSGVIFLNFADNPFTNAVWVGAIVNATRGGVATCTQRSFENNNNKLLTKWCDDYSGSGAGPTVVWEFSGDNTGGAQLGQQYSAGQFTGTGNHGRAQLYAQNFINYPEDCGTWMELIFHVKMSSARGVRDGVISVYQKKQGATGFTQIITQSEADIGSPVEDVQFTQFAQGYFIGYSNSGYDEETSFYVSQFRHTTTLPEELA